MNEIQIIDPTTYPGWNDLLLSAPGASFFHTAEWARVLSESYNYKPYYFSVIENSKLKVLLPVMEVKSCLTGKRGVSLPFSDFCPPIAGSSSEFMEVFDEAVRFGKQQGWKTLELRGGRQFLSDVAPSDIFYTHQLNFKKDAAQTFASFRDSNRRNIKKAIRQGIQVSIDHSLAAVREFYRLNCLTRREHGLPPQPYLFFKKIYDAVVSKKKGFVALASFKKKNIAAAVFFHDVRQALYKYGASDNRYRPLRPNNLVMWQAIQTFAAQGIEQLNFGRTDRDHEGLLQFKRGWGTTETTLNYYKYNLARKAFVAEGAGIKTSYSVLKITPLPLLKLAGRLLYRHIG